MILYLVLIHLCTGECHTGHPQHTKRDKQTEQADGQAVTRDTHTGGGGGGMCVTHLYKEDQYLQNRYSWKLYVRPFGFRIQRIIIR